MKLYRPRTLVVLGTALFVAGCGRPFDPDLAKSCSNGIDVGYAELQDAEAKGLSGTVQWTKAASLLGAAKVQYEFERYPNCIDKVKRARDYLKRASGA